MGKGQPCLPDLNLLIQAGINARTKLPTKCSNLDQADPELKANALRLFRIIDEQRAVNRYKWYNLPAGLSSQELERLIYYRYTLCFFYEKITGRFYFMPYALDGDLDFYGRFNRIHPVPICGSAENATKAEKKAYNAQKQMLDIIKLNVVKDVVVEENEITEELLTNSAVILRDYTNQAGQMGEARYSLHNHLLDLKADLLCFMRTNYLVSTGVQGLRVQDADCASEVNAFSKQMYDSARKGNPYVAITSKVDLQEIQPKTTAKATEFFLGIQSVDNLLLASYGLENGGVFNKKAHTLESENAVNYSNNALVNQDGLTQRQNFCNIVNSIWDLGMWCEISEVASGADINGDGVVYDEANDGSGSGYSVEENQEEEGKE